MVMAASSVKRARRTAHERQAAIKACHAAECELLVAGGEFTKEQLHQLAARKLEVFLPGVALRNRLRFVAMWADEKRMGDVHDRAGRGAKPKLNAAQCKKVIKRIRQGHPQPDGTFKPFGSMAEACEKSEYLGRLIRSTKYTPRNFWDRLRQVDPGMQRLRVVPKPVLSEKLKAERVAACQWYADKLKAEPNYLHRVFFIDCKTLICSPQAGYALIHEDDKEKLFQQHANVKKSLSDAPKIKFYAVANYHVGVYAYWICQGTTGEPLIFKA
jgi:hypothetical protein